MDKIATEASAKAAIEVALDGRADEFDVDAIAQDCYEVNGDWIIEAIDTEEFWTIVASHDRTGEAPQ